MRQVAGREALGMISSAVKSAEVLGIKPIKPIHRGKSMRTSEQVAKLVPHKSAKLFDYWLHLQGLGNRFTLDLPIKLHKHFHTLAARGRRINSYVITEDYVQISFEIETGTKLEPDRCIGIDTGINALASVSTGEQFGLDIKSLIERAKRCKWGSKGHKRAARSLRQRMDECAKEVLSKTKATLVVTEDLTGITHKTRRRLGKNIRRSIGMWNVRYWLGSLERKCEDNRVAFRRVDPKYTSQQCSACGHIDRRNRQGSVFRCVNCGFHANADVQASTNILTRFLTGPYGAGCKPLKGTVYT